MGTLNAALATSGLDSKRFELQMRFMTAVRAVAKAVTCAQSEVWMATRRKS
jgi:hypothetical protein